MQTEWSPGGGDIDPGEADGPIEEWRDDVVTSEDEAHRTAVDAVDGLLDEVELALARLDDGTYGRCEECGEPIGDERLEELPIVRTCSRCGGSGPPLTPSAVGSDEP
ncbi:MAG: TraR/DksA family transcriptional regulator [Acidimicrobiales bacterium]|jgi:RNA polymerase-binding transcription factor DksA